MQNGKSINRIKRLIDVYLGAFVLLGILASVYFGITNRGIGEKFFNNTLMVAIFLTVATAVLFFIKDKSRINAGLFHFSTFFTLFLANMFFEIPIVQRGGLEFAALREGVKWDKRNKYEVIEDFRKKNITAYPTAFFSALVSKRNFFADNFELKLEGLFPLSGIANVETVLCNEAGEWITYMADRYGFNNDDQVYEEDGEIVLIVGDSFAQGTCVPRKDNIASDLNDRGYRTISLGTGGNGPLIELATLKEYGPTLNPKIILWMYFEGNDFVDLLAEHNFLPLRKYMDRYSQNLMMRQAEIDQFWIELFGKTVEYRKNESDGYAFWTNRKIDISGLMKRIVTLYNIRKRIGLSRGSYVIQAAKETSYEKNEKIFREVMKAAKEKAKELKSELYFVYLPSMDSIQDPKRQLVPSSKKVREIVSELEIPLIDFYERLSNVPDPKGYFPYRSDGHYTGEGYDLLGDIIEEKALRGRILISKKKGQE